MAKSEQLPRLIALLREHRWAALATISDQGEAAASMVAYAHDDRHAALYLHLSQLAAHSRNLQHHPDVSLVISEADNGEGDPQQLARVTLSGRVTSLHRDMAGYEEARECYLQQLPMAARQFDFADFRLFRFTIIKVRFVGGFAQAHSYDATELDKTWKAVSQPCG